MSIEAVLQTLSGIPPLTGIPRDQIRVSSLGGLTNTNVKLDTPAGVFVLQMPSIDPIGTRDHARTIEATRMAASLGIGAGVAYADTATGMIVTRWIDASPMSAERFHSEPDKLREAAHLLRCLHRSDSRFGRRFDPFDAIRRYAASVTTSPCSPRLDAAVKSAETVQAEPAPIHGDPVPENFLGSPDGLRLVDWEYAGIGDPAWDLAYLSLEADFAPSDEERLLAAYGDPLLTMERLHVSKMVAATLAGRWGTLRAQRHLPPDLSAWTRTRLRQAEAMSASLYPTAGSG